MEIVIIIQAILILVILILFLKQVKNNKKPPELSSVYKEKEEELYGAKISLEKIKSEYNFLEILIKEKESKIKELEGIIDYQNTNTILNLKSKNSYLEGENSRLIEENKIKISLEIENKNLEIENKKIQVELAEKAKSMEKLTEIENEIKNQFKVISNEVIEKQKENFDKQQKEGLGNILNPLNKDLKLLQEKIEQAQKGNNENATRMDENIKNLMFATKDIGNKADNLATALKGDKKSQGNWGELQLQNLLEMAGLEEGVSYQKQYNIKNKNGENFFLDFIINLPEERILIVDSKVSMVNYENYINANSENEKNIHLKKYTEDIKKHIKDLGSKEYQNVYKEYNAKRKNKDTPDFVFMFVGVESAYIDAIKHDNEILNIALKNKVAIVTSSSFMPVLKMIEHLWNIENQNKYIDDIVKLVMTLYKKVEKFSKEMKNIGDSLEKANKSYIEAKNYISTGKGNVISTSEKIMKIVDKSNNGKKLALESNEEDLIDIIENNNQEEDNIENNNQEEDN